MRFTRVVETILELGTKIRRPLVGRERGVAQGDLLHDPRVLVDGDAVAETNRLGESEQHARSKVSERGRERKAGDEREYRARSEKRAGDSVVGKIERTLQMPMSDTIRQRVAGGS